MHRTTTTATLLVTVAASALSGCVTVPRPASGPPAPPSRSVPARPDGTAEPQIVQAPAREALELVGPRRDPTPTASVSRPPATAAPPPVREAPASRPGQRRQEARRPKVAPSQGPRVELPKMTEPIPTDAGDVCALGRKYGGWQQDSPESRICSQAYGR
ncbi:hypothetical protein [Streptomyces sp. GESEQ-35]|uniref:hypothetical protein n=1 Tax=Streptomyces sp. GESEQ-35 TaxID=2812657 RepID=UPI001B32162C|nr:hypothetical protein [Streptomyces sp. GESEQ-35]